MNAAASQTPPETGIRFRPARRGDGLGLWEVHTASIGAVWPKYYPRDVVDAVLGVLDPVLQEVAITDRFIAVAENRGAICGFAQANPETGELERLYVRPGEQGGGIGRALMGMAEARLRAAACPAMYLSASVAARPFYERLGFRVIGPAPWRLSDAVEVPCFAMDKRLAALAREPAPWY